MDDCAKDFIKIADHQFYIEDHNPVGEHVLILLHHGLGTSQSWAKQIDYFVRLGYRVIVYDRLGYGKSSPRTSVISPSFSGDVQDLLSLIKIKLIKKASFIGHSDGGTIGLYFSSLYPEYVDSLVTVAAHIYVEEKMLEGISTVLEKYKSDATFQKGLQRLHGDKTDQAFLNWFDGWFREENLTWDLRKNVSPVICPVLVVQGERDEHALPGHAVDIAEWVENQTTWIVEGAFHMLPQENPDLFNRRVAGFFENVYSH